MPACAGMTNYDPVSKGRGSFRMKTIYSIFQKNFQQDLVSPHLLPFGCLPVLLCPFHLFQHPYLPVFPCRSILPMPSPLFHFSIIPVFRVPSFHYSTIPIFQFYCAVSILGLICYNNYGNLILGPRKERKNLSDSLGKESNP
jgi:hypothetical protein